VGVVDETGEIASEEAVAEEPGEVAADLPEPLPFVPTHANGAAEPATASPPGGEPDIIPDGDDRVIALFPTAAARRSRMIVVPPDPDGQS
jgi:hypothetical protein